MYVEKDDNDLALKFAIVGGTDNPAFELSLKAGNVPTPKLAVGITITPKEGYLTAQFPLLPTSNKDLRDQVSREVIKQSEDHPREGPFTFTPSLQDVTWRVATHGGYEESGLPEEGFAMFDSKEIIVVTFKTTDPKTFCFERSELIKATTNRKFAHQLLDTFRLIQLDAPTQSLASLSKRLDQDTIVSSVEIQVFMRYQLPLQSAWRRVLSAPLGLPASWRYGCHDQSDRATVSSLTISYDPEMDDRRPKKWIHTNAQPGELWLYSNKYEDIICSHS
jgi:hypothetical protein